MSPLQRATQLTKYNSIEFLLAHGAAMDFRGRDKQKLDNLYETIDRYARLLFAIERLWQLYPGFEFDVNIALRPTQVVIEIEFGRRKFHRL